MCTECRGAEAGMEAVPQTEEVGHWTEERM